MERGAHPSRCGPSLGPRYRQPAFPVHRSVRRRHGKAASPLGASGRRFPSRPSAGQAAPDPRSHRFRGLEGSASEKPPGRHGYRPRVSAGSRRIPGRRALPPLPEEAGHGRGAHPRQRVRPACVAGARARAARGAENGRNAPRDRAADQPVRPVEVVRLDDRRRRADPIGRLESGRHGDGRGLFAVALRLAGVRGGPRRDRRERELRSRECSGRRGREPRRRPSRGSEDRAPQPHPGNGSAFHRKRKLPGPVGPRLAAPRGQRPGGRSRDGEQAGPAPGIHS